jgi:hypothetical protein
MFILFPLSLPNVAAQWSVRLFRIRNVPGSKLGLATGYPDLTFFVAFLGPSKEIPGQRLKLGHVRFLP